MQFTIQEQTGIPVPGAKATFYFKNAGGNLVNPIVTLTADESGKIITSDADLFTSDKFVSIEAPGYGQGIQDVTGLSGGIFTLFKLEKQDYTLLILAAIAAAAVLYHSYKK